MAPVRSFGEFCVVSCDIINDINQQVRVIMLLNTTSGYFSLLFPLMLVRIYLSE